MAAFTPTGDLGESLSSGTGFNLYYDQPFKFFISGKLPSYMPASLQAMLNYESLSGEGGADEAQKEYKNSLSRIGLEVGLTWSFLLVPSHHLGLLFLGGFASEKAKQSLPTQAMQRFKSKAERSLAVILSSITSITTRISFFQQALIRSTGPTMRQP